MQQAELTDGTIVLRPFQLQDADTHLMGEDEEQVRWLSGGKGTPESVQKWIKKNEESWKTGGPVFNFAIWSQDKLVGMVEANTSYETIEGLEKGDANISYGIYPDARGKGHAVAAVNLMAEFLKQKGIGRAVLRIDPKNTHSLEIPITCGFQDRGEVFAKLGNLRIFIKELR